MTGSIDVTEEYEEPEIGLITALTTYLGYGLLIFLGHVRDFFGKIFKPKMYSPDQSGVAPFVSDFEDFYTRRLYKRIHDCWQRPVSSCPGAWMDVVLRESKTGQRGNLLPTGETRRCLNLGSYNYLGFGDPNSPTKPAVFKALAEFGPATCSLRGGAGNTRLHVELEQLVARFVRKDAAVVFSMGFGTNSTGIPAIVGGKGTLIISDANNHTSIVIGARSSGATIKVFEHNNPRHLEAVVRKAIVDGQPRSHRPWKKIIIVCEGIYSMEGEMCPLAEIVQVKKKYKCYLYVDEAHSIGALGQSGRGICEHAGVDPKDIDILMGTFTKSFGGVGGYIAGSEELIQYIRATSIGSLCSQGINPPTTQQVISAMQIIMGEDGTDIGQNKLADLRDNANFFRKAVKDMGYHTLGDMDSPIVPIMLYNSSKIPGFSRECFDRGLAVVVVGFPATPLLLGRCRFCISAAHTRKDLEMAVEQLREVGNECGVLYNKPLWNLVC